MSFRLTQTPKFSMEVTVPIANDKGGFDKNTFIAKFKRPRLDELDELRKLSNEDLVRRQMVDWELKDPESGDVAFSTESLEAALQIPPTSQFVALAFWEGVNGARTKN